MSRLFGPRYASVAATLALFIALGGASYAALSLPRNSVGSRQLRRNAVTSPKVKDGSLRAADFAAGQVPAGPAGPAGPKGDAGAAGPKGDAGPPGPSVFPASLPSGKTEIGAFGGEDTASASPQVYAPISFAVPLAAAPTPHIIASGTTTQCPGSPAAPTAAPGQLCIYVVSVASSAGVFSPSTGSSDEADKTGAVVSVVDSSDAYIYGTWAVTAP